MLWYCRFTWNSGTTTQQVRQRVLQQHAAGTNHPEKIRGWYNLAGGGAGFLLVESDDPHDLNVILEPYMDLLRWDVHAVYELPYSSVTDHFQQMVQMAGGPATAMADAKSVIRRMTDEVYNRMNPDAIDEFFAAGYVDHAPAPGRTPDLAGLRQTIAQRRMQNSDFRETIEDLIAEGDTVVERWTIRFTHNTELEGPMGRIPPTGKQITVTGITTFRVVGGKVVERWANVDALGMYQQLGAIPASAQAAR